MESHPGSDAPTNPNHCPVCRSRNSGVWFGYNPKRINDSETLVHDVTHVCADCDATWTAWGHTIIASNLCCHCYPPVFNGGQRRVRRPITPESLRA